MTQEEKELLLKDLCARLPYGLFVHTWYNKPLDIKYTGIDLYTNTINLDIPDDDNAKVYIDNCKPYLRPMSSMTEEEKADLEEYSKQELDKYTDSVLNHANKDTIRYLQIALIYKDIDWYNKNHFDHRGLIPMGLALEASKDMYK